MSDNSNSKKIAQQSVVRNEKEFRKKKSRKAGSVDNVKFAQESVVEKYSEHDKVRQGQTANDPLNSIGQIMGLVTGVDPEKIVRGFRKAKLIGELRKKYNVKDDIPDYEIDEETLKDPRKRKALESKYYISLKGGEISKNEIDKLINASYLTDKRVSLKEIKKLNLKQYKDLYNSIDKKIGMLGNGEYTIEKINQHPVAGQIKQFRNRGMLLGDTENEPIYPTSYQIYNEEKGPIILYSDQQKSLQERFVKSSGHNYYESRDKDGRIHWYNTRPVGSVEKQSPQGFTYLEIPKGTVVDELTLREKTKRDTEFLINNPPPGIDPALIMASKYEPFKTVVEKDMYRFLLGVNQIKKGFYEDDLLNKYLHMSSGLGKIVRSVPSSILNMPEDFAQGLINAVGLLPKDMTEQIREYVDAGSTLIDIGKYAFKFGKNANPYILLYEALELGDEQVLMRMMDYKGEEVKYYDDDNKIINANDSRIKEKLKVFSKENQERLKGNQNYNHHVPPKKLKIHSSVINSTSGLSSDNISAYNMGGILSNNYVSQFSAGNNYNNSNSSGDTYGMSSVTPFGNIFFQVVASSGINVDIESTHPRVIRNGYS